MVLLLSWHCSFIVRVQLTNAASDADRGFRDVILCLGISERRVLSVWQALNINQRLDGLGDDDPGAVVSAIQSICLPGRIVMMRVSMFPVDGPVDASTDLGRMLRIMP